jgi:threonine synthase
MGRGVLYCSTRGAKRDVTFEEVVLGGLAPDKGLYVPQEVPIIPAEQLEKVK